MSSWHEREAAERAASHATGAAIIDNDITVEPDEALAGEVDEMC